MATDADRREPCDGCGRSTPLDELTAVTVPGGTVAVCPDCRSHARSVAKRAGPRCDGCADVVPGGDLADVRLPDGAVVSVCPDCRDAVPDDAASPAGEGTGPDDADPSADGADPADRERCSQCRDPGDLVPATMADGRTERLCPDCLEATRDEGIVASTGMRASRAREVLGVDGTATDEEVRGAFLEAVKTAHPDRPTGSRAAFERVVDAYERLS